MVVAVAPVGDRENALVSTNSAVKEGFCQSLVMVLRDVAPTAPPETGKCHDRISDVVLFSDLTEQLPLYHAMQERGHADAALRRAR